MEKFIPQNQNSLQDGRKIPRKIRRFAGIVSLAALSLVPQKTTETLSKKGNGIKNEDNKEWTRKEVKNDKLNEIKNALLLKNLERRKNDEIFDISFANQSINDYSQEYENRLKTGKISSFTMDKTEDIPKEIEELRTYMKSAQKVIENINSYPQKRDSNLDDIAKKTKEQILNTISHYDKGREWLLKNIETPTYKDRLSIELKNSPDKILQGRITEVNDSDYIVSNNIEKSDKDKGGNGLAEAFYDENTNKTFFPMDQADSMEAIDDAIHEYSHKMTEANKKMSLFSINLFSQAFDSLSTVANFIEKPTKKDTLEKLSYYSDPTEMYARKKVFDYDLERLGIKKYNEKFTYQHYIKALNAQQKGKLMSGSKDFLKIIKPKMIIKIMNEIAENKIPNQNELKTEFS